MRPYKNLLYLCCFFFILSCNVQPRSDRNNASGDKLFKLKIRPVVGSKYAYEVSNESKSNVEVGEKKVENINRSDVNVNYSIGKDSLGNIELGIKYTKIHIYTKNGDQESDMDAENAKISTDPTEQFLGRLMDANMKAIVSPQGEMLEVKGYREVISQMLSGMGTGDLNTKTVIQKQWQQTVEQNMMKKNIDQLFKIFPDSAVHVGDKWKTISKEGNTGMVFTIRNFYTLNSINDGIAYLTSRGEITSDTASIDAMGYAVTPNLNGSQRGEYEVDIKTGMPLNSKISAKIEGTIKTMAQEVPLVLETSIKMKGKKMD